MTIFVPVTTTERSTYFVHTDWGRTSVLNPSFCRYAAGRNPANLLRSVAKVVNCESQSPRTCPDVCLSISSFFALVIKTSVRELLSISLPLFLAVYSVDVGPIALAWCRAEKPLSFIQPFQLSCRRLPFTFLAGMLCLKHHFSPPPPSPPLPSISHLPLLHETQFFLLVPGCAWLVLDVRAKDPLGLGRVLNVSKA